LSGVKKAEDNPDNVGKSSETLGLWIDERQNQFSKQTTLRKNRTKNA
jgi:hypothetical protein